MSVALVETKTVLSPNSSPGTTPQLSLSLSLPASSPSTSITPHPLPNHHQHLPPSSSSSASPPPTFPAATNKDFLVPSIPPRKASPPSVMLSANTSPLPLEFCYPSAASSACQALLDSPPQGPLRKTKPDFIDMLAKTDDEEELFNSWKVLTRTKEVLANGSRLENASWRRWYQQKHKIKQIATPDASPSKNHSSSNSSSLASSPEESSHDREITSSTNQNLITAYATTYENEATNDLEQILKSNLKQGELASDLLGRDGWLLKNKEGPKTTKNKGSNAGNHDNNTSRRLSADYLLMGSLETVKREWRKQNNKKKVRFDESLNQTAYVSYAEDNWDSNDHEMLINVDELSRLRHAKLNGYHIRPKDADFSYFVEFKEPLAKLNDDSDFPSALKPQPVFKAPFNKMRNDLFSETQLDDEEGDLDDEEDDGEGIFAWIYTELYEVVGLFRWCAGLMFINLPKLGL